MKGSQHPPNDLPLNPSANPSIREVLGRTALDRRTFLQSAVSASVLASLGGLTMKGILASVDAAPIPPGNGFAGIGFESIPPNLVPLEDAIAVPPGYQAEILAAWGDPILPNAPPWIEEATQDAADQAGQFGMHNDGMHFFPFPDPSGGNGPPSSTHGLLCVNHEYTQEEILHGPQGIGDPAPMTVAKARKSQAAHGVSVVEIRRISGRWTILRESPLARRITGNTPARISGPAAGHALLQSRRFAIAPEASIPDGFHDGHSALGTLNNCAHGHTPWGTFLTCEENWNSYFGVRTQEPAPSNEPPPGIPDLPTHHRRYGLTRNGSGYRWHEVDPRFDLGSNPLEPHHFGWVVEIDPLDPARPPVKRTALGRFKHESAQPALTRDSSGSLLRLAYYMGDDERNEYLYKFVCHRPVNPADRAANADLLDDGTLYVASFTPQPGRLPGSFRGAWIPLQPDTDSVVDDPAVPGRKRKLRELDLFQSPSGDDRDVLARILIHTRQAGDAVGATMMDRPEWTALRTYFDPDLAPGAVPIYSAERPLEIYCTLTNNDRRGATGDNRTPSFNQPDGSTPAGSARPPVDPANPRPHNLFGHIVRWREDGNDVTATGFDWEIFVLCGDSDTALTLDTTGPAPAFDPTLAHPATALPDVYRGTIGDVPPGSADFGAPDGLWFDPFGRLWIQTDHQGTGEGHWVNLGTNVMCCADPNTREIRRFLTGPPQCEVTGMTCTPDGRSLFVGIQHPGDLSKASDPDEFSAWPGSQFATNSAGDPLPNGPRRRPRSAVLVITRQDGGVVGT